MKKRSRLIALISYIITMFIGLLVYTYYETLGNVIYYTLMIISQNFKNMKQR